MLGSAEQPERLLTEIHAFFTQGFDTPDLQEARGLLASKA
jgi:hypothetical protein